jgi:FkbM family methyltransferase
MSWLKTLLRPIARRMARVSNRLVPTLLRIRPARRLLNAVYERSGSRGARVISYFMGEAEPRNDFVWKLRIDGRTLLLPVTSQLKRSWSDALFWRWPPALPTRAFYEWYLQEARGNGAGPPILLDVGANDGMVTYPFAARGWRCVLFEPQDSCLRHIAAVCRLNDFRDVTSVQCVVAAEDAGHVEFFVSPSSWYSSLSRDQVEKFEPSQVVLLPSITIDGFVRERSLAPTCIKIDVEGAEGQVLEGARETLERDRPDLVVEILSDPPLRTRIWDLLTPLGYRFFMMTDSSERPLTPITGLDGFVAAAADRDHGDFVMLADDRLVARAQTLLVS